MNKNKNVDGWAGWVGQVGWVSKICKDGQVAGDGRDTFFGLNGVAVRATDALIARFCI